MEFTSTKDIYLIYPKPAPQVESLLHLMKHISFDELVDGLSISYIFHLLSLSRELMLHETKLRIDEKAVLVNNRNLSRNAFNIILERMDPKKVKPLYEVIFNILFFASICIDIIGDGSTYSGSQYHIFGAPNFILEFYGRALAQFDIILLRKSGRYLTIIPIEIKSLITHGGLYEFYLKTLYIEHHKILAKLGFRNITATVKPYIVGARLHEAVKDTDVRRLGVRVSTLGSIDNIRNFIVGLHTDILDKLLEQTT